MPRPISNQRLFVAIYPPPSLAQRMIDHAQSALAAITSSNELAARIATAEQVHLTLQFIGDTPASEINATIESVQRSASGLAAFTLRIGRLIALPERGPARLLAAETDSPPTLMELQRRLAKRFARAPRRNPGDNFRPHLTLCRFSPPIERARLTSAIGDLEGCWQVHEIALMRSVLTRDGARHAEIIRARLR